MDWLRDLFLDTSSPAASLLVLATVITSGLALGSASYKGIKLGVAGVLFTGLAFGHFSITIPHDVLEFVRELGLILFVYAIGLSIGRGFFNALRADGLRLNLLATATVLLGLMLTLLIGRGLGVPAPIMAGIFSGASTNTPSLAAAGQTLRDRVQMSPETDAYVTRVSPEALTSATPENHETIVRGEISKMPGLGYAATYPFGVMGIILAMLLIRWINKADPAREVEKIESEQQQKQPSLVRRSIRVTNRNLVGKRLEDLPAQQELEVVVSRILRQDRQHLAEPDFLLEEGDVLAVVGSAEHVEELRIIVGEWVDLDLVQMPSELTVRWLTVTRKAVVGVPVEKLGLGSRFHVQVTRHRRSDVELPPYSEASLSLGDQLLVVGTTEAIDAVAKVLGDQPKSLLDTDPIPVFVGIGVGILVGAIPISLPGVPAPVKLGLAGGPLLVAILLSQWQRVGSLVWYLPTSAGRVLRDLGITLFLAAVGLKSGDRFVETVVSGEGLIWMGIGAVVTFVPLMVVGILATLWMRMSYVSAMGLLAGSMTDPPALAFASGQCGSELPAVAYATVYPTTMILRIVAAQVIILSWTG